MRERVWRDLVRSGVRDLLLRTLSRSSRSRSLSRRLSLSLSLSRSRSRVLSRSRSRSRSPMPYVCMYDLKGPARLRSTLPAHCFVCQVLNSLQLHQLFIFQLCFPRKEGTYVLANLLNGLLIVSLEYRPNHQFKLGLVHSICQLLNRFTWGWAEVKPNQLTSSPNNVVTK